MFRRSFSRAAVLVIALTLGSAVSSLAQATNPNDARRVIAIREVNLKGGASAQEFERYFADVYARAWTERFPGVQTYLLRGDRGERKDKYLMVYEIDSLARRNEYWPQPGVASQKFTQLAEDMPEFEFDKYLEPVPDDAYTDYLVLNP